MIEDFNVAEFSSEQIYRNIPTNHPSRFLFGENLSEKELEIVHFWADVGSGINQSHPQKDRWYDYGDPENLSFCFDGHPINSSRYTSGSFPVWYGAIDSELASRAEIIYHLIRQSRVDFVAEEEYICYQRAMCRAKILDNRTADLREFLNLNPSYHDDPPYSESNKIGKIVNERSITGIIYPSKRLVDYSCLALFSKAAILESKVINFFTVEVFHDKVTVCGEHWENPAV